MAGRDEPEPRLVTPGVFGTGRASGGGDGDRAGGIVSGMAASGSSSPGPYDLRYRQ